MNQAKELINNKQVFQEELERFEVSILHKKFEKILGEPLQNFQYEGRYIKWCGYRICFTYPNDSRSPLYISKQDYWYKFYDKLGLIHAIEGIECQLNQQSKEPPKETFWQSVKGMFKWCLENPPK
jgi:hypothetical protein